MVDIKQTVSALFDEKGQTLTVKTKQEETVSLSELYAIDINCTTRSKDPNNRFKVLVHLVGTDSNGVDYTHRLHNFPANKLSTLVRAIQKNKKK